ncbi:MAG TPA: R3H domain-containing nucleic acid-binding protein [Candidatus Saccharibacteria bacterium]|nr:R3H domain-containing nucleic acid-binding protein [Candidatus Saccharibacteria bacterium]HRK93989.1 R3H domain-containing nucleic acid-binding protein [Candidatus Saccharibacteria bacterium]
MDHEAAIEYAKKYLEDLLSFFGVNVEVEASVTDDVIELAVPSTEANSILIGRNAETLRSLQYAVSTTLRNQNAALVRVNIDIADYKRQRAEKVAEKARGWIESVRKTGDSFVGNLNAADRRVVHQVAKEYEDIETFSEGEGRDRRIIIAQKSS